MPHITTHINFSMPIAEASRVRVWHCAVLVFVVGFVLGALLL